MRKICTAVIVVAMVLSMFGMAASADESNVTVTTSIAVAGLDTALPSYNGDVLFHHGAPAGTLLTATGALLVTDMFNRCIWVIYPGSEPEILAGGRSDITDEYGKAFPGFHDDTFLDSAFATPFAIVPYLDGYLVSDRDNHALRFLDPINGEVKTAAGAGIPGRTDGFGISAIFNLPSGMAVDDSGNVYIADTGNNCIRMLDSEGRVTTYAGGTTAGSADGSLTSARFNEPVGLTWKNGVLYVADKGNHNIRRIYNGSVTTIAGAKLPSETGAHIGGGYADGAAMKAEFSLPTAIVLDDNDTIYVFDSGNSAIREITDGVVSTLLIGDPNAGNTYPVYAAGLMFADGNLYVADGFAGIVFTVADPYDDVDFSHWFYNDVMYVTRRGLFRGVSSNLFAPQNEMSRAMMAVVLWRMAGEPKPTGAVNSHGFPDVAAGAYYEAAVTWASEKGVMLGYANGLFGSNDSITREQAVTVLYRYAQITGLDVSAGVDILSFNDAALVDNYAVSAFSWACSTGVINGMPGNMLAPDGNITRAEVSAVFHRFDALT